MSSTKKLEDISQAMVAPPKLTPQEKTAIKGGFKQLESVLDEMCANVLLMDRDKAYSFTQKLITAIKRVDQEFIEGALGPQTVTIEGKVRTALDKSRRAPDLEALLSTLEPELKAKAEKLECVTNLRDPTIGEMAICPECNAERLLACINMSDPAVAGEEEGTRIEA